MKVLNLHASGVYGRMTINVNFLPDITFLIGLNGSGKTTALRLLMGLLTPSLDDLFRIPFEHAVLEAEDGTESVVITCARSPDALRLSVSGIREPLKLDATELQLLTEPRLTLGSRLHPLRDKLQRHPVYEKIRSTGTPLYLGLDRRLERREKDTSFDVFSYARSLGEERDLEEINRPTDLREVNDLVKEIMAEVRAHQEKLDRELRERLLLNSVAFRQSEWKELTPPSAADVERYRTKQSSLEKAANFLGLPVKQVRTSLQDFFDSMDKLAAQLAPEASNKTGRARPRTPNPSPQAMMTWLINKSQVDRLIENFEQFERYAAESSVLHEPVERFVRLLNTFLRQVDKSIEIAPSGGVVARLSTGESAPIESLSSGERQLCVMLAHLALSKRLAQSGVFIVDEPELSLHVSWQEMFVDAVREANAAAQLIFATHSPAIILDKETHCRWLPTTP